MVERASLTFRPPAIAACEIDAIDLLRYKGEWVVRARSRDGAVGIAATTSRLEYIHPLLTQRVAPFFIGKDARDLPQLIDDVYRNWSNYKLAGLPFWSAVAWVEVAVLDLLGRVANQPVHAFFGEQRHPRIPVYLSVLDRESSPEQIADRLSQALNESGARAVKVKIGGRMSRNADASPGRSERLLTVLKERLPADVALCVDANGSYDVPTAIEVGHMLESLGVVLFEEPCPFDRYDDTRQVADRLTIPVAGGEQDSSVARWEQIFRDHVVDVAQPDVLYNGGLIRTAHVVEMARAAGREIALHNPHVGPSAVYGMHLAAVMNNPWQFHELNVKHITESAIATLVLPVHQGMVTLPSGAGFGLDIDERALARAEVKERIRRRARRTLGRWLAPW